jgi:hypothetical protein
LLRSLQLAVDVVLVVIKVKAALVAQVQVVVAYLVAAVPLVAQVTRVVSHRQRATTEDQVCIRVPVVVVGPEPMVPMLLVVVALLVALASLLHFLDRQLFMPVAAVAAVASMAV